jgi:hypothetical protein
MQNVEGRVQIIDAGGVGPADAALFERRFVIREVAWGARNSIS